jgi:hypothetical protein
LPNREAKVNLTPQQESKLFSAEKESFLELCRKLGCDPAEREAVVLEAMKAELEDVIAGIAEQNPSSAEKVQSDQADLREAISQRNVWKALQLVNHASGEFRIRDLVNSAAYLPINYSYLARLSKILGVTLPKEEPASALRSLLEAVPYMTIFTMRFNAFLEGESQIDALPAICMFEQLNAATKAFGSVLPMAILKLGDAGGVDVRGSGEIESTANDPGFVETCQSCLELLFCSSADAFASSEKFLFHKSSFPSAVLHYHLMVSGALDFVDFHEIGHLLMGHLEIGPCHRVEFEADRFAAIVVAQSFSEIGGTFGWRLTGVALLFALLRVLEVTNGDQPSETHPSALARLNSLRYTLGEDTVSVMTLYYQAFLKACKPALIQNWGWNGDL